MTLSSSTGVARVFLRSLNWDFGVGVLCLIASLLLMARLIWLASYHFDVTDDSFYILSALYPEDIMLKGTWFDRYTNLLWSLSSDSLAGFRRAGMIGLIAASTVLSFAISLWLKSCKPSLPLLPTVALVLNGLLFGNILYYQLFLLTPSYNWLTLFGMTLAIAGVFFHFAGTRAITVIGFLGLGGFLTFAGKPTTGLALLVLIFVLFMVASQMRRSLLALTGAIVIATLLAFTHMIFLDGGITASIDKVLAGKDATALLIPGRSLGIAGSESLGFFIALPPLVLRIFPVSIITAALLIVALIIPWPWARNIRHLLARGVLFVFAAAWAWDVWSFGHFRQPYSMHVLLMLPLGGLLIFIAAITTRPTDSRSGDQQALPLRYLIAPVIFLMLCPFIYSFGTNNRIAYHTMSAAGFTASSVLIIAILGHIYARQIIASVCVSVALFVWSNEAIKAAQLKPYRGGMPVAQMDKVLMLPAPIGTLTVTATIAAYAVQLRETAVLANFVPGTPLIDLTGGSPGAAVVLQARFVGVPWTLGGYAGSERYLDFVFDRVPSEIFKTAWLLHAPDGARAYAPEMLERRGMPFPQSYKLVGRIENGPRGEMQELWAPVVAP